MELFILSYHCICRNTYNFEPQERQHGVIEFLHSGHVTDVLQGHVYLEPEGDVHRKPRFRLNVRERLVKICLRS